MLEQRVAHLESDMSEIKSLLKELSKDVKEQVKEINALKVSVAGLESKMTAVEERLNAKLVIVEERLSGKLAGLEGHLAGIGHRFASLPTTWTLLGVVFTTWALGSGILIFAMNFLKR